MTAGGLDQAGQWQDTGDYLAPGKVLRTVFRGKFQALLRDAMQADTLQLPPNHADSDFWKSYRALYGKDWHVRVEARYAHGKGVLLYLARYCKGGPLSPGQLTDISADGVRMRYLDHRDKRVKTQRLRPLTLLQRLLMHVPAMHIHTVRHYGLYAAPAKLRWEKCAAHLGTLTKVNEPSLPMASVLLHCRTCGAATHRVSRFFPGRAKGNSINRGNLRRRTGGSAQHTDQLDSPRRSGVPDSLNKMQPDIFLALGCKLSERYME